MRGAYNTTFDAAYGPSGVWGPPGVVYLVDQPCRLVLYDRIFGASGIGVVETAWLTTDYQFLNGPAVYSAGAGTYLFDFYASDQLVVPSLGVANWWVTQYEYVWDETFTSTYGRYRLSPLPYAV